MGKKRDLANENIVKLIDEIIDYESMSISNNCPRPYICGKFDCPTDNNGKKTSCEECKEIYLGQLREKMIKKYVVV